MPPRQSLASTSCRERKVRVSFLSFMQTTDRQITDTDISATEQSRVLHAANVEYRVRVGSRWSTAQTTDPYGRPRLSKNFDVKWKSSKNSFVTLTKDMHLVAGTTNQVSRVQSSAQMRGISNVDAMLRGSRPCSCVTRSKLSVDYEARPYSWRHN